MTPAADAGADRQELTAELAQLDHQLRDLSEHWEAIESEIAQKVRQRRELIVRQDETQEDHTDEINRLQSDVYALRDQIKLLRDAHFDFSALYRIVQQARH
jgi:predicted RNase H-like nuclease (RuvC/YqgF family)